MMSQAAVALSTAERPRRRSERLRAAGFKRDKVTTAIRIKVAVTLTEEVGLHDYVGQSPRLAGRRNLRAGISMRAAFGRPARRIALKSAPRPRLTGDGRRRNQP